MFILRTMDRGYMLVNAIEVNAIELPISFVGRLLQGSLLSATVFVICNCVPNLFDQSKCSMLFKIVARFIELFTGQ